MLLTRSVLCGHLPGRDKCQTKARGLAIPFEPGRRLPSALATIDLSSTVQERYSL